MAKTSILEYLKKETKVKEYYQIPLEKKELLFIFNEDPKTIEILQDFRILIDYEVKEEDKETGIELSPYCLQFLKKGHLSNIEHQQLVNIKESIEADITRLQTLAELNRQGLTKPGDLTFALREITGEVNELELEDEELKEEEKTAIVKSMNTYNSLPEEKRSRIKGIIADKTNKSYLKDLFFSANEDKTENLINRVTKLFHLRTPEANLSKDNIACFPLSLLEKISLFIDYEASTWETKAIPQSVRRFIVQSES